jgi:hypothetical protein
MIPHSKNVLPTNLIVQHYAFGGIAFFAFTILMFLSSDSFNGHHFSPNLLTLTHTYVLGWISMIIFGALYQLLPVITLSSLYSIKLAHFTFILFALGTILICYCFWKFEIGLPMQLAAVLLFVSIILFSINVFITCKRAISKKIENDFIQTAVVWLLLTASIGLIMVFNFRYPFLPMEHLHYLKLHAHFGFVGWFVLLIIGVASKLLPMFLLSSPQKETKLKVAYYFINYGLLAFFVDGIFFELNQSRNIIYYLFVLIGILSFVSFIYNAYKSRARRVLDTSMTHTMTAIILLSVPLLCGIIVVLSNNSIQPIMPLNIIYASSFLIGFVGSLVLGQTFKTLPFIVWTSKFGKLAGKKNIPLPKELFSEKLLNLQLVFFLTGYVGLLVGLFFSLPYFIFFSPFLFIVVAILYNINIWKIISVKSSNYISYGSMEPCKQN